MRIGLIIKAGIIRHDTYDLFEITCNSWYCVHGYSFRGLRSFTRRRQKNDAIITIIAAMIAHIADNAKFSEI
jgi:hypothetical protein